MTNLKGSPAVLGAVLASALLLSGCTGDDTPERAGTSDTSTSSGSPSPADSAAALEDRSSDVLADPPELASVATAKAKATSSFRGSTFTIHGLTRSDTATVLTYSVTGGSGHSSPTDSLPRNWEKAPMLMTPTHSYRVVTFQEQGAAWAAVANPAYRIPSGAPTGPVTMLFPPLPPGTGTVTLRGAWFDDVAVPVTDVGQG